MPIGLLLFSPLSGGAYTTWNALILLVTRVGLPVMLLSVALLTAAPTSLRHGILFNSTDALPEGGTFGGALLLIAGMSAVLWASGLIAAVLIEVISVMRGAASRLDGVTIARILAMVPYLMLVGSIALLFSTFSREAGIAIAGAYLFLLLQGPVLLIIAAYRGIAQELTAYAPWAVLDSLGNRNAWNEAALGAMRQRALAAGRPLMPGASLAIVLSLVYSGAACALARIRMRRRDPL
jgi:hypothetical protein